MGQEQLCQVDAITRSKTPKCTEVLPVFLSLCSVTVTADGKICCSLSHKFKKIGTFNKWTILKNPSIAQPYFS